MDSSPTHESSNGRRCAQRINIAIIESSVVDECGPKLCLAHAGGACNSDDLVVRIHSGRGGGCLAEIRLLPASSTDVVTCPSGHLSTAVGAWVSGRNGCLLAWCSVGCLRWRLAASIEEVHDELQKSHEIISMTAGLPVPRSRLESPSNEGKVIAVMLAWASRNPSCGTYTFTPY